MEGVKTTDQIEFIDLFNGLGWKAVDVARAIDYGKSHVSLLVRGKRNPPPRILKLMRELVEKNRRAKERGEEIVNRLSGQEMLHEKLEQLQRHDPAAFEAAKLTIDTLHQRIEPKKKTSSKTDAAATRLLGKASASASKPGSK